MEVFLIFYGLIEFSNSIYVYRVGKNNYNLYITCIWGLSIVFLGLAELLNIMVLTSYAHVLFGLFWFPMAFTPCGVKIFRINNRTILLRKFVFFTIGLSQIFYLF